MKKHIAVIMLFALLIAMTACSKTPENTEPTPVPTPDKAALQAASDTDTAANAKRTPPASGTDTLDNSGYNKALACVGRSVEELYAAVGQPVSEPTYGPSCMTEGAEDGMLIYDGFYVWTIRTSEGETVHEVGRDQ